LKPLQTSIKHILQKLFFTNTADASPDYLAIRDFLQANTMQNCVGTNFANFIRKFNYQLLTGSNEFVEIPEYTANFIHPQACVHPQAYLAANGIYIDAHATVGPGACIESNVYIGVKADIRHGAFVRSHCFIANHAVVGHASEIKGSLLFPYAKAPHFNYVGDSILGVGVNLGAGTILANLRLDHKTVVLHMPMSLYDTEPDQPQKTKYMKISTHTHKFGSWVANYAQTSCNTVLQPGTVLLA
jgi:NDP-sugar pyrophosphorylase family protein